MRRFLIALAAVLLAVHTQAGEILRLVQTVPLPKVRGGFDFMAVDAAGQRLFVNAEDNGTTEIIDLKGGRLAHTIAEMREPKWVVYRPELHKLYVANGDGKVRVLNSDTYEQQGVIEFREKANNLRYDAERAQLFVGVGKTFGAIAVVDAKTDQVLAQIPLANFPKQFEVEGDSIFVNVPTANHVAVLSRSRQAVVATWPVTEAKDNVPMGFDRERHRLFVGCEPGKLIVFDTQAGKAVTSLEIATESDGISFDAKRRLLYISCGAGSLDVVRQLDSDHYEFAGRIPTAKGAGTSIFSPELDRLFLAVPQRDGYTAEIRSYSP